MASPTHLGMRTFWFSLLDPECAHGNPATISLPGWLSWYRSCSWVNLFIIYLGNLQKKHWLPKIMVFLVTSCIQRVRTLRQDLEADALVREATGPDFILISDPVANMNPEEAIRLGRFLEKLDWHFLEEPLWDEDFHSLQELTRVLEIPVAGCEVLKKHPYSVAECISRWVLDRTVTDISWTGSQRKNKNSSACRSL